MSELRERKVQQTKVMKDSLEKAKAFIFAGYRGMKVSEITSLRKELYKNNNWLKVAKNRLFKRVLEEKGVKDVSEYISEPTAIAVSDGDVAVLAKTLTEFEKKYEAFKVKGGCIEGKKVSKEQISHIAMLPSKEVLLGKALSSMLAPGNNLVSVLMGVPRKLVYAINSIKEKKSA